MRVEEEETGWLVEANDPLMDLRITACATYANEPQIWFFSYLHPTLFWLESMQIVCKSIFPFNWINLIPVSPPLFFSFGGGGFNFWLFHGIIQSYANFDDFIYINSTLLILESNSIRKINQNWWICWVIERQPSTTFIFGMKLLFVNGCGERREKKGGKIGIETKEINWRRATVEWMKHGGADMQMSRGICRPLRHGELQSFILWFSKKIKLLISGCWFFSIPTFKNRFA